MGTTFFAKKMKLNLSGKKAELTSEETVKLILAAIGIAVLLGLAAGIYSILTQKHKSEQAESSINELSLKIQSVLENEELQATFLLESPDSWKLSAWPDKKGAKPGKCIGYCICMCSSSLFRNAVEECDAKGVCKETPKYVEVSEGIKIRGPVSLKILSKKDRILISKL